MEKLTENVKVMLKPSDKERVSACAEAEGLKESTWIRIQVMKAVRRHEDEHIEQ